MRIAVCEDNKTQTELLLSMIAEWSEKKKLSADVKTYASAEAFLFAVSDEKPFDLLLLDIQMKDMTGIELAKKLRKQKNNVNIIFITALREFVFEGYSVDALQYVLKPVDKVKFFESLDKAISRIETQDKYIIADNTKINIEDIYYVEALAHYVSICTSDTTYTIKKPLSEMMKLLNCDNFIYCHRSYIVNMKLVSSIKKEELVMENGSIVPVSRSKYKIVNSAFIGLFTAMGEK